MVIPEENMDSFCYTFPVIRGIQSGREYYVTMVPLKLIPKIFLFNEKEIPLPLRSQRILNKSRIPTIARYIIENPGNYVFSALTASIDGRVKFQPLPSDDKNSKIGFLIVPVESRFLINDGQHRRAAIEQALKEKTDLGYETISVVFFVDAGLKKSQQMFADLNKYAVRPSTSLGILYDHRDKFGQLILEMIEAVPIFKNHVEKGKTSISNRSQKLFTLSSVYRATLVLLGKKNKEQITETDKKVAIDYWSQVTKHIREWQAFLDNNISSYELRQTTIVVHGIALQALGLLGNSLLKGYPATWKEKLRALEEINWGRNNIEWEGRAMIGGRLNKSYANVVLTSNLLKQKLSLSLSKKEMDYEKRIAS
jgi:DNA sulfur modification protein DndB